MVSAWNDFPIQDLLFPKEKTLTSTHHLAIAPCCICVVEVKLTPSKSRTTATLLAVEFPIRFESKARLSKEGIESDDGVIGSNFKHLCNS
jgi:hypothetical protein